MVQSARVHSAAVVGVDAHPVEIEIDLGGGLPQTVIVGLPDKAIRESRDRVRAATLASGLDFPGAGRLTINLAPAALKKVGAVYDLPIALGLLAATGQVPRAALARIALVGELALDGRLRPVRGVLAIAELAARSGWRTLVVPRDNGPEAALVAGLEVAACRDLAEVVRVVGGELAASVVRPAPRAETVDHAGPDFADVLGQAQGKLAMQLAAAGGHHVLLSGPPGVGKSMLASRLPSLLDPLDERSALEVTRIHSIAGLLAQGALVTRPPFRAPHHTISEAGLVGGGHPLRPGEASLAHHGVLFLDEAPELPRRLLDCLRQPLERGEIEVVRVCERVVYPSRFQLVIAMNPCPCGWHHADPDRCRCPPPEVERYQRRISGALADRIEIQVELGPVDPARLAAMRDDAATSASLRAGVARARAIQRERYGPGVTNASATDDVLRAACLLSNAAQRTLETAAHRGKVSARGYFRVVRLARTVADLAGEGEITADHVLQALVLRQRLTANAA